MRYVYLDDVKTHMKVTGSSSDTYIKQEIKHAEARLDSMLSVSRLDIHKVSDERHDANNVRELYCHDLHVVEVGEILDDTSEYTQTDAYDIDNYIVHLEDKSLVQGARKAHITYAAGWNAAGIAKLTVSDYSSITSAMTLTVDPGGSDPNVLTEGTEWDAATDNNTTAESIASAINTATKTGEDTATGIRAFALENVVYICDEYPGRESSTVTASVLNGLSLVSGGGTTGTAASALTMDGEDFPEDLRDVLMLMVGSAFNKRGSGGIKSYKIGSKSVSYGNGEETTEIKSKVKPYMRAAIDVV